MAQEWKRSAWYDQTFRASAPAPARLPAAAPVPNKQTRKGLKVLGLICIVLVLCAALAYVLTDGFGLEQVSDRAAPGDGARTEQGERGSKPPDYRAYFRNRSSDSRTETRSGSRLERTAPDPETELRLASAEGRESLSLRDLYLRCAPSVVGILAGTDAHVGYEIWGSGIVMTETGHILTNQHIIDGMDYATVVLPDGSEYPALLMGEDVLTDLALLKIEAQGLSPAEFGDSGELCVGDGVAAIGNPLGEQFTGTLTDGILSAIDRDVTVNGRGMTLLQTNAAINEGNSGGPLLNRLGQVVGVVNMKMVNRYSGVTVEGIGFAIPSATVKSVVDQLVKQGKVTGRPGLGITVTPVSRAEAEEFDIPIGLYVRSVSAGSDAEAKGLRTDDIITHADGEPVAAIKDLLAIRDAHAVGDRLRLLVWRNGETMELSIRIMDQNELP